MAKQALNIPFPSLVWQKKKWRKMKWEKKIFLLGQLKYLFLLGGRESVEMWKENQIMASLIFYLSIPPSVGFLQSVKSLYVHGST